nr:hypothetical protein [Tanacetum cinerariifolium]
MEEVLATLNSRELKKRTKGTKEETGDGLCVKGKTDHFGKAHSGGSLSSGFVKKGKHDKEFDSFDDEGNALAIVGNDEMTEVVMYSGRSYHITHKRNFMYDFNGFDGGSVQLGDNRTCAIKWAEKVKI